MVIYRPDGCGRTSRAELPLEASRSGFGPQLVAMAAMLISRFRLSRRDLEDVFTDLLGRARTFAGNYAGVRQRGRGRAAARLQRSAAGGEKERAGRS